jgi:1-aminocyclopropane-1-carboxylate deaminase/D-cysteine desulfhydrase-like pyridoxal-dependent ACC family enzyme
VLERCPPTPLQQIRSKAADGANVALYLKRDDLIHPQISGNKWRKLKYNLIEAHRQGQSTLMTFGGAYSSHVYAVAAAGREFGFRTVGVVRGEETLPLNPTLQFATEWGMKLHYLSREEYRHKTDAHLVGTLKEKYGNFYLLPEGGSNGLAVKGVAEGVDEINIPWQYLCCAAGTGGTLAGLVAGAGGKGQVIGFSALKGGGFLSDEARRLLGEYSSVTGAAYVEPHNLYIQTDYHFGGYGRTTPELLQYIRHFESENGLQIEQVYTGKMLYGIEDLLRNGFFPAGSTVVAVHTGGLQGRMPGI